MVDVAGGAEGLVVEARGAGGFLQLFAEFVDGAEVVGGGRDLQLAGLEELLVAAVEQAGDLAVEQPAGAGEDLDSAVGSGGDLGGAAVFPDLDGVRGSLCTFVGRGNIESLTAEQGEDVVEAAGWCLLCHKLDSN